MIARGIWFSISVTRMSEDHLLDVNSEAPATPRDVAALLLDAVFEADPEIAGSRESDTWEPEEDIATLLWGPPPNLESPEKDAWEPEEDIATLLWGPPPAPSPDAERHENVLPEGDSEQYDELVQQHPNHNAALAAQNEPLRLRVRDLGSGAQANS